MKTKLFLTAIAGVALAGCVKVEMNSLESKREQNLVTFDSPVTSKSVDTKANVYGEIGSYTYEGSTGTYTYPKEEQFKIFAVEHSGDLTGWENAVACDFNGQDLSYDINVDSWAPKNNGAYYYWPDDKKMSFAALSPADLEDVNSAVVPAYAGTGLTLSDFTIPSDPAKQFDLMFSKRAANRTAANMNHSADAYSGIPLEFQHALTSIHFSIKKDNTVAEDVVLTGIVLHNAKNKGTFNENITEGTDPAAYVVGDQGNVNPAWAVVADSKETSYQAFKGKVSFPIEAQYVAALAASDTDEADEDEISYALLLMPQTLADDVVLDINYMVGDEVKTKTVQLNTYPEGSPMTTWKIGYRYTYRLYYSKDSEKHDIISFGPSTSDWVDGGKIEIKL